MQKQCALQTQAGRVAAAAAAGAGAGAGAGEK